MYACHRSLSTWNRSLPCLGDGRCPGLGFGVKGDGLGDVLLVPRVFQGAEQVTVTGGGLVVKGDDAGEVW